MIFKNPSQYDLFKSRRQKLLRSIMDEHKTDKGVVLISAGFETDRYVFRQESSFYYLTGLTEPAIILCMFLDGREVLYMPRFGISRHQWMEVNLSGPEDAGRLNVDEVRFLGSPVPSYSFAPVFTKEKYENFLHDLSSQLDEKTKVFTVLDSNPDNFMQVNLYESLQRWLPSLQTKTIDISEQIGAARRIKDEYEIDLIYRAIQITNMAHSTAATFIKSGVTEYEVQAAIEYVFTNVAAARPAFPSIVATGKNTTILHYVERNQELKDGDLVVIDIGAEYGFYAADITRTYPVNGKFTDRQKEVYQVVLDTQTYIESIAMPGMYLRNKDYPEKSLQHLTIKFLEKAGYAQYFCHGIGHYLGLDVHDVGDYTIPLQPGDVFTIEPGVYISEENLGIRIEDDYIMADDGAVCLSYQLPKEIDDIEKMMER